jgi:hypothetical protein
MPNWCQNVVYIDHEDKEKLNSIVQELDKGEEAQFFNSLVPNPDGEWNYDWSISNWGTKWDAQIYEYSINDEGRLYVSFDTAWGPPITFYEKLCDMGYTVNGLYREEGMAFAGIFDNGYDDYYEYGSMSADEIRDQLPEELDDMFSISQYQRDVEQENRRDEWDEMCGELEKTEWYPVKIKPTRPGVYEVVTESWPHPNKIYWDGDTWLFYDFESDTGCGEFPNKIKEWRGITESQQTLNELTEQLKDMIENEEK